MFLNIITKTNNSWSVTCRAYKNGLLNSLALSYFVPMRRFSLPQAGKLIRLGLCLSGCCLLPVFTLSDTESLVDVDSSLPPVRGLIEAFTKDIKVLKRYHPWEMSETRHDRLQQLIRKYSTSLGATEFQQLAQKERIDYVLLRNQLKFESRQLDQARARYAEIKDWLPFGLAILELAEARQRVEPVEAEETATVMHDLKLQVTQSHQKVRASLESSDSSLTPGLGGRLAQTIDLYSKMLEEWYQFYAGYHPSFIWWVRSPHDATVKALEDYADFIRHEVAGFVQGQDPPLLGDPVGRRALLDALDYEMVTYTPEELLEIAQAEFAWCDRERQRAARDLGFGDDWQAAYNFVKSRYVAPGEQPQLIKRLAQEAVDFLEQRDLLSIPPLAKEVWRMRMMTAERQKVNPYFTGGEVISVSFPTESMEHEDKLMSMRGNNMHFSKATVHHELIPGHHLQLYMAERHQTHRALFRTPFLVEGWALYWEMLLWDLEFYESPEDRIGMLFWRSHRCARIIFSLSFHLGTMSAQEAIEFLVSNVGHERRNAIAEVRRSIQGGYIPLYQAAYMLGGLQIRSMYRELVESNQMTAKAFHDAILRENAIPIDMIRASLMQTPITPDYRPDWKFYHRQEPVHAKPEAQLQSNPDNRLLPSVEEALSVGKSFRGKVTQDSVKPQWFDQGAQFHYKRSLEDGKYQFRVVHTEDGSNRPAFDHHLVAQAMSLMIGNNISPDRLPVQSIDMSSPSGRILLKGQGVSWLWNPYRSHLIKWNKGNAVEAVKPERRNLEGPRSRREREEDRAGVSPNGKWRVAVKEHNLWIEDLESGQVSPLSFDGNPGNSYQPTADRERFVGMQYQREDPPVGRPRVYWSPDSKWLIAMRYEPGVERHVHIVESSPEDQLQPMLHSYTYLKPGDRIPVQKPALFNVSTRKEMTLDDTLYSNPWSINQMRWDKDSQRFTFLFNERGHQVLRVIAVEASTGNVQSLIDEQSDTFVDYAYKNHYRVMESSQEILWMSERDGWNHLYLFDAATGFMKHQITRGNWVVRQVDRVDEDKRQIWFKASGIFDGQDPYFIHFCRVNFDGTGLVRLTRSNGNHSAQYSPDGRFLLDTWSRVDQAPVVELRDASSGDLISVVEQADMRMLEASGWQKPEAFLAKGRDGSTNIHGVIYRPTHFDPSKKYPVIEKIYAGPHGSFVPKSFRSFHSAQAMAELGFVVVQIDGMGTSNRSKAFHDVCWRNIGDAGFPDRIAWMKAAAESRPYMDLSRVGIYGGSAGGQNTLRGLLAHGDFYKAGVADCGCHDNRMDKIWWNELWMGWPLGLHYHEQSNVTQAHRLKGKLLLMVGEMDRNVDPASTMQVVDALIKADKDFDMLVMPGVGHGAAGTPYGKKRMAQFFMKHLLNESH